MVEVVYLNAGERPTKGEPYLVIEWAVTGGSSYRYHDDGFTYKIGPEKQSFWLIEAPILAERLGLSKMYFIGRPADLTGCDEAAFRSNAAGGKRVSGNPLAKRFGKPRAYVAHAMKMFAQRSERRRR